MIIGSERGYKKMTNIDLKLNEWAINKIKMDYPKDVALLVGQLGRCKIPTDEQNIMFVLDKGEILYARSEEDKFHFLELERRLHKNLADCTYGNRKALEHVNTALEIFQTMLFESSMCKRRKAAGAIANFLTAAIAFENGRYLKKGYEDLTSEIRDIRDVPESFGSLYHDMIRVKQVEEIKRICYRLLETTRNFFLDRKTRKILKSFLIFSYMVEKVVL